MNPLDKKQVLLGVTGGIAAYKAAGLTRLLGKSGADVHVAMTAAALRFVGKTTFEALSGNPVLTDLFSGAGGAIRHIDLAGTADVAVVAPATADIIAKLAHGIGDDALSTTLLAVTGPVMICPAMNADMYRNPRVTRNLDILRSDGCRVLEPDSGSLACNAEGPGRLPEPEVIVDRLSALLTPCDLAGKTVLVTAGPTREAVDPVRFISNRSSGKMGYALASAAEKRGAQVTLVSGPTALAPPLEVEVIRVVGADRMAAEVLPRAERADIVLKVAAVCDFGPPEVRRNKIKKTGETAGLELFLERKIDILKTIGRRKQKGCFVVGFAAETREVEKNAALKLNAKNLDMIAANRVGAGEGGFDSDANELTLISRDGSKVEIPMMEKSLAADLILDHVLQKMG